jgi:hypothetical protein
MVTTPPRLQRHKAFNFGDSPEDAGKAYPSAVGDQLSSPQLAATLESMSGACNVHAAATDTMKYNRIESPLPETSKKPAFHMVCDGKRPPHVYVDMADWDSIDDRCLGKTCSSVSRIRRSGPGFGSPGAASSQKPKYVPPPALPVSRTHAPLRSLVRAHMTQVTHPYTLLVDGSPVM